MGLCEPKLCLPLVLTTPSRAGHSRGALQHRECILPVFIPAGANTQATS